MSRGILPPGIKRGLVQSPGKDELLQEQAWSSMHVAQIPKVQSCLPPEPSELLQPGCGSRGWFPKHKPVQGWENPAHRWGFGARLSLPTPGFSTCCRDHISCVQRVKTAWRQPGIISSRAKLLHRECRGACSSGLPDGLSSAEPAELAPHSSSAGCEEEQHSPALPSSRVFQRQAAPVQL